MPKLTDALTQWLSLTWERPERSYNPNVRDFFAALLGYPKNKVVTEDRAAGGFSDVKLITEDGTEWVVGELKKDDDELLYEAKRIALWHEKRKYVDGLTAHCFWIVTPDSEPVPGFEMPLDLRTVTNDALAARLAFLRYETANHINLWKEFIEGSLPYNYLRLGNHETYPHAAVNFDMTQRMIRNDLRAGFTEITEAAADTIQELEADYRDYNKQRKEIEQNLVGHLDTQRRVLVRLELDTAFVRHLFEETLPHFEEQYGRYIEASKPQEQAKRIREAFVADSAAALIARVLFLRLVEDLGMQPRRLSNGGPRDWARFVKNLTGDSRALVRHISEDMERVYREPFAPTVFDWIQRANEKLNIALQRLIVRLNAYNFVGLSEEILGDIYREFLPPQKRKRLGEFYTPPSIVEWILDHTVREHEFGTLLDPSCGSGSFLVRYTHWRLEDARERNFDMGLVSQELQREVWGFDLNPFAAFISHFQLLWAMLRADPEGRIPCVEVHNLNSLLSDRSIAQYISEAHLPSGAKARDGMKWRYIVGNPPYIRAERVKYGSEMRELWAHIWGKNGDTGLLVLYRALTEWLEPEGWFGMVVSGGYANTEMAGKVWRLLHPGQIASLRKIVWLEFIEAEGKPTSVWDVSRIPMITLVSGKSGGFRHPFRYFGSLCPPMRLHSFG